MWLRSEQGQAGLSSAHNQSRFWLVIEEEFIKGHWEILESSGGGRAHDKVTFPPDPPPPSDSPDGKQLPLQPLLWVLPQLRDAPIA